MLHLHSITSGRDAATVLAERLEQAEADRAALCDMLRRIVEADPDDAMLIRMMQLRAGILVGVVSS